MVVRSDRAVRMLSAGPDGEGVKVVREDRPGAPGLHSSLALQAGSPQPITALEVADAALRSGAVAREASLRPARARLLAASDEHPLGREASEGFGAGT